MRRCRTKWFRLIALLVAAGMCAFPVSFSRAEESDSDSDWDTVMMLEPSPQGHSHPKRRRLSKHRSRAGSNQAAQRTWHHALAEDFVLHAGHAFPPLVIHVLGKPDPFVIDVGHDQGGFDDHAQLMAREAFGTWEGGPSVHPRLLELIYQATRHFKAPSCHLISGLRRDRQASRHSHGMAADIVLPGVKDVELAAYFRAQGFTGVGTYPRSGFVHIDVRETSYFWVDRSPPGKHWRVVQVRGEEARAADQQASTRGLVAEADPEALRHALVTRPVRKRPKPKQRRGHK